MQAYELNATATVFRGLPGTVHLDSAGPCWLLPATNSDSPKVSLWFAVQALHACSCHTKT